MIGKGSGLARAALAVLAAGVLLAGVEAGSGAPPAPACYIGFDGSAHAAGPEARYANLNRLYNEEVPLDYAPGRVGKARRTGSGSIAIFPNAIRIWSARCGRTWVTVISPHRRSLSGPSR